MTDYYGRNVPEYSPVPGKVRQSELPPQGVPDIGDYNVGSQAQSVQLQHVPKYARYSPEPISFDFKDILKRAIKYLFEGLAVAFVAHYFTKGKLELREVALLGVTAACVFAILDTFSPTISLGARFGAGFGIGQTMFGLNPTLVASPVAPLL